MAITRLLCLKEAKRGKVSQHLQNCITYILKPGKTENGRWVGGNCSRDAKECYQIMMQTKMRFAFQRADKLKGRQGYHFMLALPKGEGDMETLMQVTQEFCEQYLGDAYEYIYAGHTDKEHKHAHIVFNSVGRIDGIKYRYNNGDWARQIQPLVNEICRKYNLSALAIGRNLDSIGEPYAAWLAEKEGKTNWKYVIRMDIDRAISKASSYEQFLEILRKEHYTVRTGLSKKYGEYVSYRPAEKAKAMRSYQLGVGYDPAAIRYRIVHKGQEMKRAYYNVIRLKSQRVQSFRIPYCKLKRMQMSGYQLRYARRVILAKKMYQRKSGFAYCSRKDYYELHQLSMELVYLYRHGLQNAEHVATWQDQLQTKAEQIKKDRRKLYQRYAHYKGGEFSAFKRYEEWVRQKETELPDEEMRMIGEAYAAYQIEREQLNQRAAEYRNQQKICGRIIKRMNADKVRTDIKERKEDGYPEQKRIGKGGDVGKKAATHLH